MTTDDAPENLLTAAADLGESIALIAACFSEMQTVPASVGQMVGRLDRLVGAGKAISLACENFREAVLATEI